MEIILDCERMKYKYTGLFEYCYQLSHALLTTKASDDHLVIYTQKQNLEYFAEGTSIKPQRTLHKYIFPKIDTKIDIWHATHQTSRYLPPANRHAKIVITFHDLNFLYEEKSELKRKCYLKKHQINIDRADHIVAISEYTKQDILKHLKVNVPISVIYNGCNTEKFPRHNTPVYQPQKEFLFALGTNNAKKNFHVLPCLIKNTNLELIIAGTEDSAYVKKIKREATSFGVEDRVKIIGPISKEDKYWYYKNCQAFLFPSIAEGFGIPVIEAMQFGKPTFLSTTTSLPEIGGDCAYYFENFEPEHMQEIFKSGMKDFALTRPEQSIINHASQFNWNNSARAYWEVYRSLMH
ncbi:glycosyltransferase involved in cell wall biosynthesis [Pedobacter sp. CAN_A7]|uniref:glycosyltransferase family 4 protein n=1 Tax=Pedobacter sp. CAN_A7 TaxID=2787722 RepID=UPI0018C99ED7